MAIPERLATPGARPDAEPVRALVRAARLLERASSELNLAHYRVLSAIASGDGRASRVASRLAVGKPTVSAAVDALCRRGLIRRGGVDTDQRATSLTLTPEGEELLARVETELYAELAELCERTPDGAQVLQSLTWLGAAIDELVAERAAGGQRAAR
jgi:DNA-binding MarR family transcriptional regulator